MTSSNLYPQLEKRELLNSLEDVVKHFVASMLHFCNPSSREEVDANSRRRFHLLPPPSTARMPITALRIAYLASIAHGGIASRTLICKRDVYYMCSALFPKQTLVDSALSALGLVLNVDRNDLNIIAAAKGIVAGRVCFVEESGCRVDVGMFGSHGCLIPARPERMTHVEISASATLVLEKETVFQSILSDPFAEEYLKSFIVITGKGYPDIGTRRFIDKISHLPTFIVTDADPHGIAIAACYMTNLRQSNVKWLGIRPSHNTVYFTLSPHVLLPLSDADNQNVDATLRKLHSHSNSSTTQQFLPLVSELLVLKQRQVKFEMEALSAVYEPNRGSALFQYIISNLQHGAA